MNPKNATRRALSLLHARRPRTNRPAAHNGSTTTKRKGSGRFTKRVGVLAIIVLAAMSFGVYVVLAANQFWNTNGVSNTWTAANWGTTAAGPFTNGWTANNDANFTANSLITYVTNTAVGNINVTNGSTVTMTAAGTYNTNGAVRTLDVGTGSILDFAAQSISSAAGTGFIKNGNGIFFSSNGNAYTGGFTLNAGTIIIGGVNAMGNGGPLTINGGTFAANATRNITARYSSVTIGGDFTIGAVTTGVPSGNGTNAANITFGDNMSLGAATRTITIGSNANYTLGGIISGSAGSGLTVANASGATGTLTLNGANTYTGDTTISSGKLSLGTTGSIANSTNIILAGGSTFDVSTRGGVTLASGQGLKGSGTTTTGTIATAASNGLTTAANSPLQFTAFNGTTAPLTIGGAGTVTLASGNPVTVTVANGGTPLGAGTYTLISKGASGTVAGTAPTSLTVNGDGLASGAIASLQITGSQLVMNVLSTTGKYRSRQSGNWSDFNTWQTDTGGGFVNAVSGQTPTSAADTIQIQSPHTVTVTASVDADQLTVDSGGTLSVNNGVTFTIADGTGTDLTDNGIVATAGNITNNGQAIINDTLQINQGGFPGGGTGTYAYNQTTGVLVFNNTSGSFGVNNVNFWPTTNGPQNVNVKGLGGGITMNVARTVGGLFQYASGVSGAGNLTLNGTSQVNTGGFVSGSPTYGASSLLKYNTGPYGRNGEWLPNVTSGAGYPANVQLSSNTALDLPNGSSGVFFQMAGNLTIDSGSTMNLNGSPAMTQPLTVGGNILNNGALNLSAAPGGDIKVGGNWTRGGTFTPNGRAVFFTGTGIQTITVTGGGTETFAYLINDKPAANIQLNNSPLTNVTVNATTGDALQFINNGFLNTGINTLTLASNGGNILVSGGVRSITGQGIVAFSGSKTIANAGGGTLVFDTSINVTLNAAVNFGPSVSAINGTLTINSGGSVNANPPAYGSNSKLLYNCGCAYGRSAEWSATSGPGYPANVQLSSSTTLDLGANGGAANARQMAGNLTIDGGSQLSMAITPMTAALSVLGNVTVSSGGTLTLSSAPGGDLRLQRDFTNNGTFAHNNRAVFFEGGSTNNQVVFDASGTVTMPYVRINKSNAALPVQLNSNMLTLGPNGGDSIQFTGANSTLLLNGRTLTLGSTVGAAPAGSGFIGATDSSLSLQDGGTGPGGPMGVITFVSGAENLNNLTLNRTGPSGSVTLGSNLTIATNLTLTAGILDTAANTLTMSGNATSNGAHNGANASYVTGRMKKIYDATPKDFTFDLGTTGGPTDGYTPASVNAQLTSATGDVTATVTNAHHPTLSGSSLNRYWSLTNNGLTLANLVFNYLDGDLPATPPEAALVTFKIDGPVAVTPVGSAVNPATNQINMTGATSFSDWTAGAPDAPTAVRMVSFEAIADEGGALIRWQTGREVDNLGFNLYREDAGRRSRVTPSIVAGSALLAGPKTVLTAGQSYSWWDARARPGSRYYLEDIDLNGKRTLHGPVTPDAGKGRPAASRAQSALLSELRPDAARAAAATTQGQPASLNEQVARSAATAQAERINNGKDAPDNSGDPLAQQRIIAAGQAIKLQVRHRGWYQVSAYALFAAGLDPQAEQSTLQLFADGVEQPILIRSDNDRSLGTNGTIEFYGVGLDTPGSDARSYWLINGSQPGKRIDAGDGSASSPAQPASQTDSNAPSNAPLNAPLNARLNANSIGGPQSFAYTVERRDRVVFFAALHNGDAENFFGPVISTAAVAQTLDVRQPDPSATADATLEVSLQGGTMQTHQVRLRLNGQDLGLAQFNAQERKHIQLPIPQASLIAGQNTITLTSEGGDTDVSVVDYVRLTYARRYAADNDSLTFSMTGRSGVIIEGFTKPLVNVFDITDPHNVRAVESKVQPQGAGYSVKVPGNGQTRSLIALASDRAEEVADVIANQPSTLTGDNQPGADLVILTHGAFRGAVEPLAQLRRSQGLQVSVVDVEDVYDEFSYGAHSALAVKEFLSWAAANWQRAPRYLLLVGDASLDPRDYLGYGNQDYVPTRMVDSAFLETASDDALADFNEDGLAEMAVGRLPVRTVSQAERVVAKIVTYVPGVSAQGALLVSDHNDGYDFEGVNQQVQSLLPAGMSVAVVNRGDNPTEQVRSQIIGGINQGPQVVNFVGHGSVEVWTGASLLSSADAAALTNGNRLPLFISMTCLNGYFQDLSTESLAEALLKAEHGGAVAAWASSGLSQPGGQSAMDQRLIQLLFSGADSPMLGDAIRSAKTATDDRDVRRTWILFGDPTMRLR